MLEVIVKILLIVIVDFACQYLTILYYCKKNKGNCSSCKCWLCPKLKYDCGEELYSDDILFMYNKGISINAIVTTLFKYKNRNLPSTQKVGTMIIIPRTRITKEECRKEVEDIILSQKQKGRPNI